MSEQEDLPEGESEVPPPDFLVPGVRTGLEMALVGILVALIGLPAENALYLGIVMLAAFLAMIVVLFWALNQQMQRWILHAEGKPTVHGEALE
ncbi:MAG: hypothetical protein ABEH35_07925 [Haloarculaceae archaeon]